MRVGLLPVLALALAVGGGGCSATPGTAPTGDPSPGDGSSTVEYLPGRAADVHLPSVAVGSAVPVVLLVPGGGWVTAQREGLDPLADALADAGMVVVNATYRASADGATFPQPVDDVRCAAGLAVAAAADAGLVAEQVVLVGHSAGGHLAALAATTDSEPAEPCPHPPAPPDGLVGLAGVYDTAALEFALVELFGTARADDPDRWAAGDPVQRVRAGEAPTGLRTLLLHGDADQDVPIEQSRAFEAALRQAGREVRLEVLPGVTHASVYEASVVAPSIVAWIEEATPEP
jgi:acetyl esterase/lipase